MQTKINHSPNGVLRKGTEYTEKNLLFNAFLCGLCASVVRLKEEECKNKR